MLSVNSLCVPVSVVLCIILQVCVRRDRCHIKRLCRILVCIVMYVALVLSLLTYSYGCRCLEGLFDTWGVFGQGFNNNLTLGGPTPIGARKANLSQEVASHLAEVALNEQV